MLTEALKTTAESLFNNIEINEIIEFDRCLILEEITSKLEEHLKEESSDANATDGVFDAITALSSEVRKEFEFYLGETTTKNVFLSHGQKYFIYC